MNPKKIMLTAAYVLFFSALAVLGYALYSLADIPIWAVLAPATLAFVLSSPELVMAARGHYVLFYLSAGLVGVATAMAFEHQWAFVLPPLLLAVAKTARLLFYQHFNRGSMIWWEPTWALASIGLYIGLLLLQPELPGWQAWLYQAPLLLVGGAVATMTTLDRIRMKRNTAGGYAVAVGQPAPDFALPNENGDLIRLSDYRGKRHVLLIFYRGDWCPYCNMMLRTYARETQKFKAKNILLLGVGPDDPQANRQLVEALGLDFHLLADPTLQVVNQFGIRVKGYNPGNHAQTSGNSPLPASFLVDHNGILQHTSHPDKPGEYLNPALIFPILDALDAPTQ